MKVIGKADKFYTLWEVNTEVVVTRFDKYTKEIHTYIKNLSYDLDVAKAKVPGASVDESLHGHSSWTAVKHEIVDNGTFRCGKYFGEKILGHGDVNYMVWYYNACAIDIEKVLLLENLSEYGYKLINDKLWSPEEIENHDSKMAKIEELRYKLENGETIECMPTSNLHEDGGCVIDDVLYIEWPVENTAEMYYAGYYYYLPMKNGKAKRIKNKNLVIVPASYEVVDCGNPYINVVVKDFEIVK